LCNRAPERVARHVVGEAAPSIDLDDRKPLPILGLENVVAGDVHLSQHEPELRLELPDLRKRSLAEVAVGRVIDDDVDYG
jgi:hypothetical protein